jgi:hypothetical protein
MFDRLDYRQALHIYLVHLQIIRATKMNYGSDSSIHGKLRLTMKLRRIGGPGRVLQAIYQAAARNTRQSVPSIYKHLYSTVIPGSLRRSVYGIHNVAPIFDAYNTTFLLNKRENGGHDIERIEHGSIPQKPYSAS